MFTFVTPIIGLSIKNYIWTEAESKDKPGGTLMLELTITSPYVHSRVDSNTFTMGNPMTESSLTLCQSRLYPLVRDFGFGLRVWQCTYFRWSVSNMHLSSKRRSFAYVHVPQSAYTCPWSCAFRSRALHHVPLITGDQGPLTTFDQVPLINPGHLPSRSPMIMWPWSRLITSSWQPMITCHWSLLIMGPWTHNPWSCALDHELDHLPLNDHPWVCALDHVPLITLDHVILRHFSWPSCM